MGSVLGWRWTAWVRSAGAAVLGSLLPCPRAAGSCCPLSCVSRPLSYHPDGGCRASPTGVDVSAVGLCRHSRHRPSWERFRPPPGTLPEPAIPRRRSLAGPMWTGWRHWPPARTADAGHRLSGRSRCPASQSGSGDVTPCATVRRRSRRSADARTPSSSHASRT